MGLIMADDWRIAAEKWLYKRGKAWESKQSKGGEEMDFDPDLAAM
jgi:hypothetical protein